MTSCRRSGRARPSPRGSPARAPRGRSRRRAASSRMSSSSPSSASSSLRLGVCSPRRPRSGRELGAGSCRLRERRDRPRRSAAVADHRGIGHLRARARRSVASICSTRRLDRAGSSHALPTSRHDLDLARDHFGPLAPRVQHTASSDGDATSSCSWSGRGWSGSEATARAHMIALDPALALVACRPSG